MSDLPIIKEIFLPADRFMTAAALAEGAELNSNAAIFGIPFDCGTSMHRIGARHGPDAIRQQSKMLGPYHELYPSVHLIQAHDLVDLGNVRVVPGIFDPSFDLIYEAARFVSGSGAVPITFGGDGSVTLPQLRAVSRIWPDLTCIHIDSHTDTYPHQANDPGPHTTATTFYTVAEEELLDPSRSFHLGFHGDTSISDAIDPALELGYNLFSLRQLIDTGMHSIIADMKEIIGDRPVYICFDMDIFDPACAPGVCNPTWGGLNAREGIELIRYLKEFNIVAVDINTVSPPHDSGGMTAWLAATVAHEFLAVLL